MKRSPAFFAVAIAPLLVWGCATSGPEKKADLNRPPIAAAWTPCGTASPGARCDIAVSVAGAPAGSCPESSIRVDPDQLSLGGGRPVNIFWNLPEPYRFCEDHGDGVFFKSPIAELGPDFSEAHLADDLDGRRVADRLSTCKRFYKLNWRNKDPHLAQVYRYGLQFRNPQTGAVCRVDPFIRNG